MTDNDSDVEEVGLINKFKYLFAYGEDYLSYLKLLLSIGYNLPKKNPIISNFWSPIKNKFTKNMPFNFFLNGLFINIESAYK